MKDNLDRSYWSNRYRTNQIGWDVGFCTPPIKSFADRLVNKNLKILIPGAGNAYEAEYMFNTGFKNIFVVDIAPEPISNFLNRVPNFPRNQALVQDFFEIKNSYDLIIEQTFFCAISPDLRPAYAKKMAELLNPGGRLVGVMFNKVFETQGPPFGGTKDEYLGYFQNLFSKIEIIDCINSIPSRAGHEFWIELVK